MGAGLAFAVLVALGVDAISRGVRASALVDVAGRTDSDALRWAQSSLDLSPSYLAPRSLPVRSFRRRGRLSL